MPAEQSCDVVLGLQQPTEDLEQPTERITAGAGGIRASPDKRTSAAR